MHSLKIIILLLTVGSFLFSSSKNITAKENNSFDLNLTKAFSLNKTITWHGYYEFEFWNKENSNNTFDAHKMTLWMGLPVNEKVFISAEVEYEHFTRLKDGDQRIGENGEIKLDSAQLSITPNKLSRAFFGIFYVPFGIEFHSYPGHKNKLITRPKLMKSGGIIPGTWSDVGIGVNQSIPQIGQADFFVINGDAKNGGIALDSKKEGNPNKSTGLRIQLDKLIDNINLGASYVIGKWDSDNHNKSYRFGSHIRIDSNKLFNINYSPILIAEYVRGTDTNGSSIKGINKKVKGFYTQVSSHIHPSTELAVRYGQYDNDTKINDNNKTETSFGLIFHFWENFQIKGEYQINSEKTTKKIDNNLYTFQLVASW